MVKSEYKTIPEIAKLLGISRTAVYKKVKRRQLPAIKIGRNYAISSNDIPYILGEKMTKDDENRVKLVVKRAVKEYGQVFEWLSRT